MFFAPNDSIVESTQLALVAHSLEFCGNAAGGFTYRDETMAAMAGPSALAETSCTSFRIDPNLDADLFIDRSNELFHKRNLGYAILLRDEIDIDIDIAAARRGMRLLSEPLPRMIVGERVELGEIEQIELVDNEAGLDVWAEVVGNAFGSEYPPAALRMDLSPASRVLDNPAITFLLAFVGGVAVSGGMLYRYQDLAYISNVGTVAEYRNRGAATSLVRYATNLGFDRGATTTFLFASHGAERIWKRIGFETISFIHHRISE